MKFNEQVTRIEPSPLRAFNDMAVSYTHLTLPTT